MWHRRIGILATLLVAALCVPAFVGSARAEQLPWDQEAVTKLSREFYEAIKVVRQATMNDPRIRQSPQPEAKQLLDTLRSLERSCRQLSDRLANGDDLDATMGTARRIGSLLRDAQQASRRLMTDESRWKAIDDAVAILNKLSPYYSDSSPLMPQPMQR